MFRKKFVPRWAEKRILRLYEQNIREVEHRRRQANMKCATGGQPNLREYSYSIGKVAAFEELMDQLFIEYDDHGRVKELPL